MGVDITVTRKQFYELCRLLKWAEGYYSDVVAWKCVTENEREEMEGMQRTAAELFEAITGGEE